jgi:hypothetical protein
MAYCLQVQRTGGSKSSHEMIHRWTWERSRKGSRIKWLTRCARGLMTRQRRRSGRSSTAATLVLMPPSSTGAISPPPSLAACKSHFSIIQSPRIRLVSSKTRLTAFSECDIAITAGYMWAEWPPRSRAWGGLPSPARRRESDFSLTTECWGFESSRGAAPGLSHQVPKWNVASC